MYPEWCTQDRKPGNTVLCTVRQGKEDSTRNSKNKSLLLMQKQILNTSKKKREISWCKWVFLKHQSTCILKITSWNIYYKSGK